MNKRIQISNGGGLDNLVLREGDVNVPKPKEVRIRWRASSLNYHDYLVANGGISVAEGRVPLSDGAGEIVEVGKEVSQWKTGDRVMSLFFPSWISANPTAANTKDISGETVDGFGQYFSCLREESITAIPQGYCFEEAATLPCAALTAWRALVVEGNIKAGESVLVEGTGGMSVFALQIAKSLGARVFATTGSDDKMERLKSLGAEEVIHYKKDPKWGKSLYNMTGGIDHVLDVGGNATMRNSIDAVKVYGNIYSIGILGGPKGEILFPKLFFKHIHLIGLAVGSAAMQNDLVDSINEKKWKPVIDKSFMLESLADAFRYQESGKHFGKIVMKF